MSDKFREGDRVEYVGPPSDKPHDTAVGERGWVLTYDLYDAWVVTWDRAGIEVCPERVLRKVRDRNEPDPLKRVSREGSTTGAHMTGRPWVLRG